MGKLDGMNKNLAAMTERMGKDRVAKMFGVDPATLEPKEIPEPSEVAHSERNEHLCKAITEAGECVEEAVEELGKVVVGSMPKIPEGLATDKGIEKSIKALAAVIKSALKEKPETVVPALLERMVEMIEENQRLSAELIKAMAVEEKEESRDVVFDISRDRNNFIASVTARH